MRQHRAEENNTSLGHPLSSCPVNHCYCHRVGVFACAPPHMWLVLLGELQAEEIWNLKPLQILPKTEPNRRPWRMEALARPGPVTSSLGSILVARRPSSSPTDSGGVPVLLWALVPQPEMVSRPLRALQRHSSHSHGGPTPSECPDHPSLTGVELYSLSALHGRGHI